MIDINNGFRAAAPCDTARRVTCILQHMHRRATGLDAPHLTSEADAVDALLARARATRAHFQVLVSDWLPSVRYAGATGSLDKHHAAMLQRYAQRGAMTLLELFDEALRQKPVQRAIHDNPLSKDSIEWLRGLVKSSNAMISVTPAGVVSQVGGFERVLVPESLAPVVPGSERPMSMLARTWDQHGRGLVSIQPFAPSDQHANATISFVDAMALAVAAGATYFDAEVRDLEDLRALPAVQGADAGIGVLVSAAFIIVAFVLWEVAEKSGDPGLQGFLFWFSTALSGGITAVYGWLEHGAPTSGCILLPTGERKCFAI